jgi:hypothetical protein
MKFRDIISGKRQLSESEMKFQALAMAKEIHTTLAGITFIEMLSVMNPDNPAVKEVQDLETKLNQLSGEVGEFIQKYIPDVADAEAGDDSEIDVDDEDVKSAKAAKAAKTIKESDKPLKHHSVIVSYTKKSDPHRRFEATFKTTHNSDKSETERRAKEAFEAKGRTIYKFDHQ